MAGRLGTRKLPDLYDPEQPLGAPTPLPVYHIAGTGGFVAKDGLCANTSCTAMHLEGKRVRDVVAEALERSATIWCVFPGHTAWHKVLEPLRG